MLFVLGVILIVLSLNRNGHIDLVVLGIGMTALLADRVSDALETRK